jgi:hypothetical protein
MLNKQMLLFTVLMFLLITNTASSQELNDIEKFEIERQNINKTGMMVLGGWAIGNIAIGTFGNFKAKGEAKYFHQFNAMWNTVNLGLAVFGYLGAVNSDPAQMSNVEIIKEFNNFQNIFLLNAGLDAAYIATGLYLREKSKNSSKNKNRLTGYGNSLFVQGGFLMVFDLAMYFIHQQNADVNLYPVIQNNLDAALGIGVNITL